MFPNDEDDYDDEDEYGEEEEEKDDSEPVQMTPLQGDLPENSLCCICLQVPVDAQLITCNHIYCLPCITQWLSLGISKRKCPMCRRKIE